MINRATNYAMLYFLIPFYFLTPLAKAAEVVVVNPNIPGASNDVASKGPAGWVAGFYSFALLVSGVLAFGAIVYGGFLYATSAGNASRQGEGRAWITSALLGLLLLGGAYIILRTINPDLTNLQIAPLSSPKQ